MPKLPKHCPVEYKPSKMFGGDDAAIYNAGTYAHLGMNAANVQFYNGSSWQTVATYVADTDFVNDQFYNEQVTILESSYTFSSNMKIKFECIGSSNTDDIYIDEVVISGN